MKVLIEIGWAVLLAAGTLVAAYFAAQFLNFIF